MDNLITLSEYLQKMGLQNEASRIIQLAQNEPELQSWQEVLIAAEEPVSDQVLTAIKYVTKGAAEMYQSAQELNKLSEADLKLLVEIAAKTKSANLTEFNGLNKTAQMSFVKSLGTKALRLMPVIGFIFSFLIALKNFVYGLTTFTKLVKDSSQVDLSWLEVLFPEKLSEKVSQYQNDPEKLTILVRLTKYSKEFSDEAISFIANILDFIKDIIFLFIDVGSFGWLTIGDISLSFILMGLEYVIESNSLPKFDPIISNIVSIANNKIQELSAEIDPNFFAPEMDNELDPNFFAEPSPGL